MYLFRLIYYSKNAIIDSDHPNQRAELKQIMAKAQQHNPALGVTGALLFNQIYFAQVLEGDRKAVTDVFCKIAKDPRHTDLVILEARPISKRRFADWSMRFVGQPAAEEVHRRYCTSNELLPMKMSADSLLGFMGELIEMPPPAARADGPRKSNGKTVPQATV
ncbi:MAG: BLUF domain-containing protein [Hyphomicrobiales bacterium]|nr:BLUF domain-containing protein [Hyphomicrobiales bacterium]